MLAFARIIDNDGIERGKLMLSVAYPVAADGTVSRPREDDISLDVLAEQIRTNTVPEASPPFPVES